ncbi:MAG: hypothetical protein KME29_06300 [Calothrix sp. FI2-JRJ7]|nr:hypothetical protein [Calothrix sp. FI2-JRJ7]
MNLNPGEGGVITKQSLLQSGLRTLIGQVLHKSALYQVGLTDLGSIHREISLLVINPQ